MKEIICRTFSDGTGIYMSAEKGASLFLDEINRLFRHEIMFEDHISGSHCFPAPIMKPLPAFSSDFRMVFTTGAVSAYYGASGIAAGIPKSSRSSGVVPFVTMLLSILIGLRHFNFAVRMTVIISETFFLPCSVLVPNVRRLKITEFLKHCSKIDCALKFVNSYSEIVSFDKDFFRRLPVKIQAGFVERAIEVQVFLAINNSIFELKKEKIKKIENTSRSVLLNT